MTNEETQERITQLFHKQQALTLAVLQLLGGQTAEQKTACRAGLTRATNEYLMLLGDAATPATDAQVALMLQVFLEALGPAPGQQPG